MQGTGIGLTFIESSPQLPTPRRSLFTSGIFAAKADRGKNDMSWSLNQMSLSNTCASAEGATTPPISTPVWEGVTTPPIPSSSPYYAGESMEISPLPHKQPFSFLRQIHVQSPTPEPSPDEDMTSPCEPAAINLFQVPQERPLEYAASCYSLLLRLTIT